MTNTGAAAQQSPAARSQPKPGFHTQYQGATAPQTPPKKGAVAGRGVPPPIPPNKPVIPCKQTPARRPESADDKKKASSGGSKEAAPSSGESSRSGSQGIEILGQELADFQQMFVTMATSNNT